MQVPVHQFGGCTSERCLASEHLPKRRAQRIQVRADIDLHSRENNTKLHRVVRKRPAGAPGKLLSRSTNLCVPLYVLPVVIGTKNTRLTGTSDGMTYSTEPGSRKFWAG
jgi:hypothetical protein